MTRYIPTLLGAFLAFSASAAGAAPAVGIALGERPIRRAEVVAFVKRQFADMDTNRDGAIGPAEYQASRTRQGDKASAGLGYIGRSWFEKSDVDHDGRVTPVEAQARPLHFFDLADVDDDGVASVREQTIASLLIGR